MLVFGAQVLDRPAGCPMAQISGRSIDSSCVVQIEDHTIKIHSSERISLIASPSLFERAARQSRVDMAIVTGWCGQPTSSIGDVSLRKYLLNSDQTERVNLHASLALSYQTAPRAVVEAWVIDYQQNPSVLILSYTDDICKWEESSRDHKQL